MSEGRDTRDCREVYHNIHLPSSVNVVGGTRVSSL